MISRWEFKEKTERETENLYVNLITLNLKKCLTLMHN
jgi:hypothetical protein